MSNPSFSLSIRVYYEDTDAAGVVYYANYLKFFERARTEWLRSMGIELPRMKDQENLLFAVARVEVDYQIPAKLGDLVDATVELVGHRGARLVLNQNIARAATQLCHAKVTLACLDATTFKPRRPGTTLARALETARTL